MTYFLITLLLFLIILWYFPIADKYNIIDKPNYRSSHTTITLRGGGIIFWFTGLLYFVQHFESSYLFFIGITLISLVSFWDDIQSLPNILRAVTHFISISLIFIQLDIFRFFPLWAIILVYVISIGIINAYNFMDGINGITGLYTLTVMGTLFFVNEHVQHFVDSDIIIYPILGSAVFLFFNFRKQAKCFAGDIGSIAIAFWIIFLLLKLIIVTDSVVWILFLAVYGVDTVCTIIHRLYLRQNIFEAHRMHFYQVLSNEYKIDHRVVSVVYATTQAAVSLTVLFFYQTALPVIFIITLLPLLLVYTTKFYLVKKMKAVNQININ